MKAVLTLSLLVGLTSSALAANPLTPAEQTVCRSLSHCMMIVETHPFDSFDYDVLADEFARFGPKGQRALIKRVGNSGVDAGHAADLLAIMAVPDTLTSLKNMSARNALAARTVEAIETRLNAQSNRPSKPRLTPHSGVRCTTPIVEGSENRRDQMPFFETRIAQADSYGAFRPSAAFRFDIKDQPAPRYTSRAWLRMAVPVTGGWIATYPDALVYYSSRTGEPTFLSEQCMSGLFMKRPDQRHVSVWGVMIDGNKTTKILSITADTVSDVGTLNGSMTDALRLPHNDLCLTSDSGDQVTLKPDGSMVTDCDSRTEPHD